MLDDAMRTLARFRILQAGLSLMNRLPVPYSLMPVTIRSSKMRAHTFDRLLTLYLWKARALEDFESECLIETAKHCRYAVDIGANIGIYSLLLGKYIESTGSVWAFEPDPSAYQILLRNISENHHANIQARNIAVTHYTGFGKLYLSDSHHGDHRIFPSESRRKSIPVTFAALDDFFEKNQKIDHMKIDVQGAEGLVLDGATRILKDNERIKIFLEFTPELITQSGQSPIQIVKKLRDLGFTMMDIDERDRSLKPFDTELFLSTSKKGAYKNLLVSRQ